MTVGRSLALSLFAVPALLGLTGCSADGPGTKSDCDLTGCTVTFDRGVDASVKVLGVEAKVVAVNGNTVTMKVGNQQVDVPVGETEPSNGMSVTVKELTNDKVTVKIATGLTPS
ncbi:MAG: hypothetical protein HOQ24_04530 [Mycobacteriaceae bacterium]|nr:hypothetical protein [Mycobacteriaceae bacterium]